MYYYQMRNIPLWLHTCTSLMETSVQSRVTFIFLQIFFESYQLLYIRVLGHRNLSSAFINNARRSIKRRNAARSGYNLIGASSLVMGLHSVSEEV